MAFWSRTKASSDKPDLPYIPFLSSLVRDPESPSGVPPVVFGLTKTGFFKDPDSGAKRSLDDRAAWVQAYYDLVHEEMYGHESLFDG